MGSGRGKGGCSSEAGRIVLWMNWVAVWLITSIFVALAVITFGKLWQAATEFNYGPTQLAKNKVWRGPLASLALSAALVFGFNCCCCIILVKKSVNRAGAGFSYGFMVAFALSLSFFLLLCGLVLDGFRPEVQTNLEPKYDTNGTLISGAASWSSYSSESYIGTEVMALISFVTYFIFSVVLVVLQSAVNDQLGIEAPGDAAAPALVATDFKAVPAAPPPDYDAYQQQVAAQQAKYAAYAAVDPSQYAYDPNAGMYKAAVAGADGSPTAGGYAAVYGGGYGVDVNGQAYHVPVGYGGGYGYNAYTVPSALDDTGASAAPAPGAYSNPHQQV